jgi:hypothetical protein
MRRIAICLLGLTLTLGFVGCGDDATDTDTTTTTPPAGDATGTETPAEPANP